MFICGYNNCGQLGESSDNQSIWGDGIICPPCKSHFNPSTLLSFSAYFEHTIIINRNGRAYTIGNNKECQISPNLPKQVFYKETEIQFKDLNGHPLKFLSAVCGESYTIYHVTSDPDDSTKSFLIYISKKHKPLFVNINGRTPVTLYGGHTIAGCIDKEGSIIIITDKIVFSNNGKALVKNLPSSEKAVQLACCEGFVCALSESGKLYMSPIANRGETAEFKEVEELSKIKITAVSGKYMHCIAVANDGRVFGRGSNSNNRLGITKDESMKFTEIKSILKKGKIINAEAGYGHSLFKSSEGKIYACGSNFYGHLLLKKATKNSPPVETLPLCTDPFCIAGYCISAVMNSREVPPNMPNTKVRKIHQTRPNMARKSEEKEDQVEEAKEIEKVENKQFELRPAAKTAKHDKRNSKMQLNKAEKSDINNGENQAEKGENKHTKKTKRNSRLHIKKVDKNDAKEAETVTTKEDKSDTKSDDVQEEKVDTFTTIDVEVDDDKDKKSDSEKDETQLNKPLKISTSKSSPQFTEKPAPKSPGSPKSTKKNFKPKIIEIESSENDDDYDTKGRKDEKSDSEKDEIQLNKQLKINTSKSSPQFVEKMQPKSPSSPKSPKKKSNFFFSSNEEKEKSDTKNDDDKLIDSLSIGSSDDDEPKPSKSPIKSDTESPKTKPQRSPKSADGKSSLSELLDLKEKLRQKEEEISQLMKEKEIFTKKEIEYKERINELEQKSIKEDKTKSQLELIDSTKLHRVKQISNSSQAEIFEVYNDDHFAQKIFYSKNKIDKSDVNNFIKNCEALIGLNCPNVVKIYGINFSDSTQPHSILFELCSSNLKEKVKDLTSDECIKVIVGVCNGMREIHRCGIAHFNLKLENILLDEENNAKVSDFGICKLLKKDFESLKKNVFMAPELIKGEDDCNEKVDVYAFGVVVFAVLNSGNPPIITVDEVGEGKKATIPLNVTKFSRHLINRCWAFDPSDRPSFDEIYSMLKDNENKLI